MAMTDSAVTWRHEDAVAHVTCGPLHGRIGIDALGTRFSLKSWLGQAINGYSVLGTEGPATKSDSPEEVAFNDSYVRGRDLILRLAKRSPFQFDPQVYWRVTAHYEYRAVQIELVLSIQTDLLDSEPEWRVSSLPIHGQCFHAARLSPDGFAELPIDHKELAFERSQSCEHLFLFRNPTCGVSYAEMVHPTDFVCANLVTAAWSLTSSLFPDRLEKGVIRRGRICGWFMPAENDLETAVKLAREFVDEPPPLTA
jgi:hypothetical protein